MSQYECMSCNRKLISQFDFFDDLILWKLIKDNIVNFDKQNRREVAFNEAISHEEQLINLLAEYDQKDIDHTLSMWHQHRNIYENIKVCPSCKQYMCLKQYITFGSKIDLSNDHWKTMIDNKANSWLSKWKDRASILKNIMNRTQNNYCIIDTVCYGVEDRPSTEILREKFEINQLHPPHSAYFTDHAYAYKANDGYGNIYVLGYHEDVGLIITTLGLLTSTIALVASIIQLLIVKKTKRLSSTKEYNYRISIKEFKDDKIVKDILIEIPKEEIDTKNIIKRINDENQEK